MQWKNLNKVLHLNLKHTEIESVSNDDGVIWEPDQIATAFNDYFATVGAKTSDSISSTQNPLEYKLTQVNINFHL